MLLPNRWRMGDEQIGGGRERSRSEEKRSRAEGEEEKKSRDEGEEKEKKPLRYRPNFHCCGRRQYT